MIGCIRPFALAVMLGTATFSQMASACLQTHATGVDGKPKIVNGLFPMVPRGAVPLEGWERRAADLAADPAFASDPKKRNDYAVALIHLSRIPEAIPILEDIEAKSPGEYLTAVNLGTAYERSGRNELALKWIKEGIKRNAASHEGTEWLHARIIETKLSIQKDPGWLETHSVFDGGPPLTGNDAKPAAPRPFVDSEGKPRDANDVIKAINYQLGERTRFVKPPEPIVAELLIEYASLVAQTNSVEQAMEAMKMAGEYKPVRAALYADRNSYFEGTIRANPKSGRYAGENDSYFFFGSLFLVVLGLAAALFFKVRRWVRLRHKPG